MAGRFTFAVPRRTENHVHIPRDINNSSVSIRVGFSPGGYRAEKNREKENFRNGLCAFEKCILCTK